MELFGVIIISTIVYYFGKLLCCQNNYTNKRILQQIASYASIHQQDHDNSSLHGLSNINITEEYEENNNLVPPKYEDIYN